MRSLSGMPNSRCSFPFSPPGWNSGLRSCDTAGLLQQEREMQDRDAPGFVPGNPKRLNEAVADIASRDVTGEVLANDNAPNGT